MKKLVFALLLGFIPVAAEAQLLKIVEAHSPDVHCIFTSGCVPAFTPGSAPTPWGGSLLTWTYRGRDRSRAAGLWLYEYKLDLSAAAAARPLTCIRSVTIDFGDVVSLNYGGDAKADHMFVITAGGGPGNIGVARAVQNPGERTIEFIFSREVCPGIFREKGEGGSTYTWGLVSRQPPRAISAELRTSPRPGPPIFSLAARGPSRP